MAFYTEEITWADTVRHKHEFLDQITEDEFTPEHIIIRVPSTNTGNTEFGFYKDKNQHIVPSGVSYTFDRINLADLTRFYIKFATASDTVFITAW